MSFLQPDVKTSAAELAKSISAGLKPDTTPDPAANGGE